MVECWFTGHLAICLRVVGSMPTWDKVLSNAQIFVPSLGALCVAVCENPCDTGILFFSADSFFFCSRNWNIIHTLYKIGHETNICQKFIKNTRHCVPDILSSPYWRYCWRDVSRQQQGRSPRPPTPSVRTCRPSCSTSAAIDGPSSSTTPKLTASWSKVYRYRGTV